MNETNPWEKHLESWTPRPPSAKVKQRLFAQPVQNPPAASYSHWLLGTAAASLVILLMWTLPKTTGGQSGLALASLPAGSNKMDVLCSNIIGFYANDGSSCRHNNSSDNTFDWTKASHSLSTTGSFPVWKTNIQKL